MENLEKEIVHELKVAPLIPTNYHRKLLAGAQHTFGLIPKRGGTPEMSPISFTRARLYKLLVQLGDILGIQDYTSISVQHNYTLTRRKEKQGAAAHMVLLGSYSDVGIRIPEQEKVYYTQRISIPLDTSKECIIPSVVSSGDRYLILYHKIQTTNQPFQKPEFLDCNGTIKLSCGDDVRLPKSRQNFVREIKEVLIDWS